MEWEMNHSFAKSVVDAIGYGGFLKCLKETYKRLELYSCSTDWYHDSRFICKCRGTKGDLIITWEKEVAVNG